MQDGLSEVDNTQEHPAPLLVPYAWFFENWKKPLEEPRNRGKKHREKHAEIAAMRPALHRFCSWVESMGWAPKCP